CHVVAVNCDNGASLTDSAVDLALDFCLSVAANCCLEQYHVAISPTGRDEKHFTFTNDVCWICHFPHPQLARATRTLALVVVAASSCSADQRRLMRWIICANG